MSPVRTVNVELGERSYSIQIGAGLCFSGDLAEKIAEITGKEKVMIVTDSHVKSAAEKIAAILKKKVDLRALHVFPFGEQSKNLQSVENICRHAARMHLDRKSFLIAVGGGVCGDMTGFAAAIYMRGIRFIQIPTSLLAMADSSVGGKTGADLPEGKNLIGAFLQPEAVFIDPLFLNTIDCWNISLGFAEIIKIAALFDRKFFSLLEKNVFTLMARSDLPMVEEVLRQACQLKADVVAKDERESSLRALLNYGHTFGHALEVLDGFDKIFHGYGVSIGMMAACHLAELLQMQDPQETLRLAEVLKDYNLPCYIPPRFEVKEICRAMLADKKADGGRLKFILPRGIGKAEIVTDIPEKTVIRALKMTYFTD